MNMRTLRQAMLCGVAFAMTGVAVAQTAGNSAAPARTAASPRYGSFGVDLTARDTAVKPGDDFWTHANGAWDKRTAIAPDRPMAGPALTLVDEAEAQVRAILDDAAKNPAAVGQGAQQMGDLYASFLDTAAIEAAGTKPLQPYFATIDAANNKTKLQVLFASVGYASPISIGQLPNPSDPTQYIAAASQGGLGMPSREYYLDADPKYAAFRTAYLAYVTKMMTMAGLPDTGARAERMIALETAMAKAHWTPVQQRDLAAMLKPMDAAGRAKLAPEFDWPLMLKTAGYDRFPVIIMATDTALTELGKLYAATPVSTWQDWLKFNFVRGRAGVLPKAFDDATFDFYGKTLSGQQAQRDRWKRGIGLVNGVLGEQVGKIYVARHYPAESNAKMAELIADLRAAYGERISGSKWMDQPTRTKALAKLAAFDPRIGHPVKWIDYSSLKVTRGDPIGNAMRAAEFGQQLQLSKLGKPVDRELWDMTPQTVNAYYNPLANQITFPAAILQAPMFDPRADAAVNYGAIGAVIGHEMGHGFDDQGSRFGPTGKFENWWTPAASTAFKDRTKVLVDQFNQYEPIPGVKVKGELTLGENIGDLGGLEAAYGAYQKYQAKHGKAPVIDGLTGDQRFFLSYAQAWRAKVRENAARAALLSDPHSPAYYRVNGIVRNVDAWYTAFNVKPGDKMYLAPEQRVKIW